MKVSVVICTKDRVQELVDCVRSVLAQSVSLVEIIIVDASDKDEAYLKIKGEFHQDSRLKYIHSTGSSSLSADRNKGVRNSSGDIILFLDDDTALDKDFIKKIVEVFEEDSEKKIGGVTGNIVNIDRPNTFWKKLRANLHLLITRIFLLPTTGNGRFRSSGCPSFLSSSDEITNVEFLSGCCMAYRKEVFRDFKFDEDFPELYTDDEDFSRRVSLKYRNVYTPYAKLIHKLSPIGSASARRASQYTRSRKTVKSRYYLLKKNFPHTLKHTLAFWWSVVGLLVQATLTVNKENVKGVINGVSDIKRLAAS
jgi:GT2 family glycosyltransferase